ncbi:beta-galactosidase [bacterium]|nr:MAG: beta-galactosidase [bacterium]
MLLTVLAAFAAQSFAVVGDRFELDGKPFVIHSGEIHYPRIPEAYWRQRLKMARAMGLNTVCTYTFWNLHEPKPGKWDFKGNLDVAKFVRIAGEEGLKVIVRPGPYICTELDFGGLPAWTLKDRSMRVRSKDPKFMALTQKYFTRLGKELTPLLIQNGGPIIMTQVENEYGSYGADHEYMAGVRDALIQAGFTGQLFTSDGPSQGMLNGGTLPGIPATINFGGGAEGAFKELAKFRPTSPRMIGEFWAGWFDQWGKRHNRSNVSNNLKDLEWCLKNGVSWNLYMFHGGTNFAFMPGSNGNANTYDVDVTSYDYDSALDESGRVTPKYNAFRELLARYSKEPLPPVPAMPKPIKVPAVHLMEGQYLAPSATPVRSAEPMSFEDLDQDYGLMGYTATAPKAGSLTLTVRRLMDYATVYVDGKRIGTMDRRKGQKSIELEVRAGSKIELLVEAMSRVNFGGALPDERKGIEGPVTLGNESLTGWTHERYTLAPPKGGTWNALLPSSPALERPIYYRGKLQVSEPGDTFLDLRGFNKGFVWVNGRNLGRFWKIGPQQTLYLPGVWLKKGANEVVVLDEGPRTSVVPTIAGLDTPILDSIQGTTVGRNRKPGQNVDFAGLTAVSSGEWTNGATPQTATFKGRGRYLAIEALSEHGEGPYASIAELWAVGVDGNDLPRTEWKVAFADSEELDAENGSANNVFDLQPTTFWHTAYSGGAPGMPHRLVIDLGRVVDLSGIRVLPRQEGVNGRIKGYRIFLSDTPFKGQ